MPKLTHQVWRIKDRELSLSRPRIMGILNVTPDSFSDGGDNFDPKQAVRTGLEMLDQGADILDVGGESTRPGHLPVSSDEEGKRVLSVVRALAKEGAIVSVDTRHSDVAQICCELGACIINDVEGFRDPAMRRLAVETGVGCVVMHWDLGQEQMQTGRRAVSLEGHRISEETVMLQTAALRRRTLPESAPIMRKIMGFLGDQARILMQEGVAKERICIDPGPGFSKECDEDVVIQRSLESMVSMGYPLLCAVSRKRFCGRLSGETQAAARDAATLGLCLAAVEKGARILRVHNVCAAAQAVNTYWAASCRDPRQGFISLGSNMGNRLANLAEAIRLIEEIPLTCVVNVSHAYETEPSYGLVNPVANAVAEIRCELHPLVLMDELLAIERRLGRRRPEDSSQKGPRSIDLDLIWMEDEIHQGHKLTLPHPRLGERDYVLIPMEDLMHNPERFLLHHGVEVLPREKRVGHVMADLGEISRT